MDGAKIFTPPSSSPPPFLLLLRCDALLTLALSTTSLSPGRRASPLTFFLRALHHAAGGDSRLAVTTEHISLLRLVKTEGALRVVAGVGGEGARALGHKNGADEVYDGAKEHI